MKSICFLSSARYSKPLDETSKKKFQALEPLGELFVIGFSPHLRPGRFTEHAQFYLVSELPFPVLRYAEMFLLGPLLACWVILRHRVEILVAQSPYEGFAGVLAKKIVGLLGYRVILVVESHGDFEESIFTQRRVILPAFYRFFMRQAARFSLRHTDLLRAISNSTKKQLQRWISDISIIQFPAWTDIEVFLNPALVETRSRVQEILYTGVLIPRKGVHYLINAFAGVAKDFPQARLIIVGREDDKLYVTALKEQVNALDLTRRVEFVPPVSQVILASRMRRACVFILPSVSEGLGRVVIEAMASSTPVIGSNVGGIPDMVQDGATGFLVPPGDEAALAKRIRWILEHPEEACAMGRRSRAFAQEFFSTDVYLRGFRQIFETAQGLLAGRRANARSAL
jgi:glycosyltransferase involved in cell wall biosynthesis